MLAALGLSNTQWACTGSAPINPAILIFFAALGLDIFEIYGQSEDCGPTSLNVKEKCRLGSAGPPFPGTEVKVSPEDGEILVKGPQVFVGYFKDEAATKEVLQDGWLLSGDIGRLDEEGFLYITGRKKDILITAGGKNITPINIENAIKAHPLIGDCVVVGDARPYLIALVALDLEAANKALAARKLPENCAPGGMLELDSTVTSLEALVASSAVRDSIGAHIEAVNGDLAQVETIKRFSVLLPFSIEKGEVTPTLKVKRAAVNRAYAEEIERIYSLPM
eukprot:TRINITY_DN5728_c0_g2_i1.p1 TRINITY_DN5728_c0_g2~~TRINITY_DN5728_c0_g2_i1.p1  ORF type:complete len:279 (-),score=52.88 TRINITY_DN5728_c0_g2_i1:23-859(-)